MNVSNRRGKILVVSFNHRFGLPPESETPVRPLTRSERDYENSVTDLVVKSLTAAGERQSFLDGSGRASVTVGDLRIGRGEYRPGWRWSRHAGPLTGQGSAAHLGYIVSGRMAVRALDGRQVELGSGDVFQVAAGHDAWVLGEQPCVALDFAIKV